MAPLPPSSTARLWLDYITAAQGVEHTLLIRLAAAGSTFRQQAQDDLLAVLNALGPGFFRVGWSFLRARVADVNQDISIAVPLSPTLAAFVGTNNTSFPRDREAVESRFVGRSVTGRKVSLSLYGVKPNVSITGFRVEGGTSGDALLVRNAVAALNASDADTFQCIDGSEPIWYDYMNVSYNRYWQGRIRITS